MQVNKLIEIMKKMKATEDMEGKKALLIEKSNSILLKRLLYFAYGKGRKQLFIPHGRIPENVIDGHTSDYTLDQFMNTDLTPFYLDRSDKSGARETAWVRNNKRLTEAESKLLCDAVEWGMTGKSETDTPFPYEWGIPSSLVVEVYGDQHFEDQSELEKKADPTAPKRGRPEGSKNSNKRQLKPRVQNESTKA